MTENTTTQRPPRHLQREGRDFWKQIIGAYLLENHHLAVLTLACEAKDRNVQARELLDKEGLTITNKSGLSRPHPAVAIERDSAIRLLRAIRELSLDAEAATEYTRPARIAGGRRYVGGGA